MSRAWHKPPSLSAELYCCKNKIIQKYHWVQTTNGYCVRSVQWSKLSLGRALTQFSIYIGPFQCAASQLISCRHWHAAQSHTVTVFIVCNLSKYVSTLHEALTKLSGENRPPLSHCLKRMSPQDRDRNLLDLSCCCCTKAKSGCIRRLKVIKTGDMQRRAPSPSFAHSELFGEKPWAQRVLLPMPQWLPRALKGLQSLDLHSTCSLQTQRRPPKWEGGPPERMLPEPFFGLI